MRGIVLEIKKTRCIILTKDGAFEEIPNRNYTVGQQVSVANPAIGKYLAAVACLAVVCLSAFGYDLYYTPSSYVYMDINPSVRLDLNCFQRVIDVVPLNEDAQVLLADMSNIRGSAETCMTTIVSACQEQHYLNEDNTDIEVSVHTDNEQLEAAVENVSATIARENLEVSVFQMDKVENDRAVKQQISPRRLRVVQMYTDQFGGTLDENLALLKTLTNKDIMQLTLSARRPARQPEAASPQSEADASETAEPSVREEPAAPAKKPFRKFGAKSKLPSREPQEDTQSTESPRLSKPSAEQLAKRRKAVQAYTAQFGGTLEENFKALQGRSSREIYNLIKAARSGEAPYSSSQTETP